MSAGRTGLGEVSGKKRESGEEQIFTLSFSFGLN